MPEVSTPIPDSVAVDRNICQSAATCLAYKMYELDDEAKAVLLTANGQNSDDPGNPLSDPTGNVKITDLVNPDSLSLDELRQTVLESAKSCPFNAIIVHDAQGHQIWPEVEE